MELTHLLEDFKIFRKPPGKIKFPLLPLLNERNMAQIVGFYVEADLQDREEILDHFELEYELEYKYHMMTTNRFRGLPRRYENIVKIIDKKARVVIAALARTFEIVFKDWLAAHAFTNPHMWALYRAQSLEGLNTEESWNSVYWEWDKYFRQKEYPPTEEKFLRDLNDNIDAMPDTYQFFERAAEEEARGRVFADLEDLRGGYMELDDWNEKYGQDAKTVEEAEELDDLAIEHISDVYDYIENYIGSLSEFYYIQNKRVIVEMYRELVFPMWFQYWQSRGLIEIHQKIENVYNQLRTISQKPIKKQFMLLNIAKNTSHQSGSMMEYYEGRYDVSEEDLKSLTETDVTPWNKELRQIGLQIKN